ncbi:MAG: general secretion pathway protein GspK [Gemmatimonadaceae bacterium]|nr:general secretion pathway protein GspK [Gemmatimonadaceae bacterium]
MKRRTVRSRRGVALIVVLWSIAVLATITAMASQGARGSAEMTSNLRAQAIARSMAESGVIAASTLIDDSLRVLAGDASARSSYLNALEPSVDGAPAFLQDTLADGVLAVTVVDVSARLDVNSAGVEGLTTLLASTTSRMAAEQSAARIDAYIRGDASTTASESQRARDSLTASLLGRDLTTRRRPFESLDALQQIDGIDQAALLRVAPLLTVDGNGTVNRRRAAREVIAAASGSLVDAPSRLLIIARGWQRGHALSRQIEAVYDVADDGLRLVRWREREL